MKKKLVLGLLPAVVLLAAPLAASPYGFAAGGSTGTASAVSASHPVSRAQAEAIAVNAVGGGQVTHISSDTYQGKAVYDVHVLRQGVLYDVKVSQSSGVVAQKKLASEQPSRVSSPSSSSGTSASPGPSVSASQAGQLAVNAVGGGYVAHISADHYQARPVWDVHVSYQGQVWDVKISQGTGSVVQQKLSSEQHARASKDQAPDSQDQPDHKSSSGSASSSGSIAYGRKLSAVPSAYQQYVTQALQQENGRLKWVKFIHKHNGETQANIKIRRAQGGTVKVKDLFSASGQLIQQKVNH